MLGTLKSSGSPSPLRRRAEYLVLNKGDKISTDFRLCKIFNANLFGTLYDLKKAKCRYTGKGKMTRLKGQSRNHSALNLNDLAEFHHAC